MSSAPSSGPPPIQQDLAGYETLVAVCGGIAAYKTATLVSRLAQRGAGVSVLMTEAAQRFITPLTFESLTARRVFTSVWHSPDTHDPQHIRLTDAADLFIIAPATANTIGRLAAGLGDDVVTTTALTANCPILLAPAMNTRMWENRIVQRNLATLEEYGYRQVPPESGWLACRTIGAGRMAEPESILDAALTLLKQSPPRSSVDGA
ncbi:MAG TPA: flavoprotein [Phycisphaerae bacterium]|nr:flavoprotein [Phycisphaerae bacterium]HRW53207.1 flavoprotein [Phycisphaerae bacterium]